MRIELRVSNVNDKFIAWQHRAIDQRNPPPQAQPHLTPHRYIKMTRFPSLYSVSIEDLISKYGATLFRSAIARFATVWRNPQITRLRLEQDIQDVHIPFTTVSVYHRIRYRDKTFEVPTVDSIQIRPNRMDKKGQTIAGRFDTALVHYGNGERMGIHGEPLSMHTSTILKKLLLAYGIAQVRVIFSINKTAAKLLFGERNLPPHHLAYVQWFTPFQANSEPKTGLYKVSHLIQNNDPVVSIVPVSNIAQSVHLSPLPGCPMPRDWTSDIVVEKCDNFLVNSFSDDQTYLFFHNNK